MLNLQDGVNRLTKIFALNPPGKWIRTGRLVRESKNHTQSWPPIHLAYMVGVLEKQGYECKLFDASVMSRDYGETSKIINDFNPEAICYFWAYDSKTQDLEYANKLAEDYRVILVGPWSAHYPTALDDCPNVESMTFGPFEYTVADLVEKRETKGVKYRDGSFVTQGEPYNREQLDWMPFVTSVYKEHLEIPAYRQTSFRYPFVDLFAGGQGSCLWACRFCSWVNGMFQLHPRRYQTRSLRHVLDELWYVKQEIPYVNQIFFQDSTLPTPWGLEIADAIIDEGLDVCWGCYSRPDKSYDEIMRFKEAGCNGFHVGYECPDQGVLDEINKGVSVEQITRFAHDMERAGMWQSMSLMIFPWMSEDQIRHMINWAKDMNPTRINVAQLQAYPGTPIMDVLNAYRDMPGKRLMGFDEMKYWEQYCFKEFYLYNPRFWWTVLTHPREWLNVLEDAMGMLRFLKE